MSHIAVAVSGGADSLYSLISLQRAGAEVTALHALFLPEFLRPPSYAPMLERLAESCSRLGAPLHLLDCSSVFADKVIRPFARAYLESRTPNPCAACNPAMKFGLLRDEALRLGADFYATGHYARLEFREKDPGGAPALYAGADKTKDQSYFLALTPAENFRRVLFPTGNKRKAEVLAELAKLGQRPAQAGESNEICFIPGNDYRAFLRAYLDREPGLGRLPGPGPVLLPDGREIARHRGLWNYTEGQRHGLGIAWSEPLYVLGKDPAANTLLVGARADFGCRGCRCGLVNYLAPFTDWPAEVFVKTRYRQTFMPARAEREAGGLRLEFLPAPANLAGTAPAPGQVAAVYAGEGRDCADMRLLAGGLIRQAE
ncbi:MAG: tRNA 2-thiouridine(34) synthase MnmA [Deltaproteobacteria bacterium]|nr:tRNA 2-thiouridine(34) synthase MnmA [Deltaproteobacteria bacterium]